MSQRRQERTIKQQVTYEVECDLCHRTVRVDPPARYHAEPEGWVHFSSGHSDWGNDSVESQEEWDACSWRCYVGLVQTIVNDYGSPRAPSLVVDGRDLTFIRDMLKHQ